MCVARPPNILTWIALALLVATTSVARADGTEASTDEAAPAAGPVDLSEPVAAPPAKPDKPDWETALPERRCGFSFGLVTGGMLGAVEGFPNDAEKVDREAFFTETGFAGGGQVSNWFGIALTDWFTFGLGGHYGALVSGDLETSFWGGNFHIDVFPLYGLGGEWREVGLNLDAGVSTMTTSHVDDPDTGLIESGGASRVAIGAYYEGFRWWKLSMGPFATFDQLWSTTAYRPTAWLGWRTAFYVGPYDND